jgi:hypothetical protein
MCAFVHPHGMSHARCGKYVVGRTVHMDHLGRTVHMDHLGKFHYA